VKVRWIEPGDTVEASRGDTVVCIVQAGADDDALASTLRAVAAHTPDDVPIVACGDAELGTIIAASASADVVVLAAGCVVADGWLGGLRAAAYADARVATATPLGSEKAPLALAAGSTIADAAAAVHGASLRLRPQLEAPGWDCAYIRRSALELVGSDGGDGAAFARRCVEVGLSHVLADDVLVHTFTGSMRGPTSGPIARSVGIARRALTGLSVVVDARILAGPMNGTKLHVLELLSALAHTGEAGVTAIAPDDLEHETARLLHAIPNLAVVAETGADAVERADVVHRPYQVSAPADLSFLARRAGRVVITHQDLISYHNPAYFPGVRGWEGYRELTERALAVADHVVFFSAHARDDALAEGLVEAHRSTVIHIGVDHALLANTTVRHEPPPGVQRLGRDQPMMLCLGTDYLHKNRVFAIRLLAELQHAHGWDGSLVLAGLHVQFGSSIEAERRLLARSERLAGEVIDLGAVGESAKAWLFERAALAVYPTVHEGFGLVPFEAADAGVPCLWAPGTALREVLPDTAAGIVPWDAAASAGRALALMSDPRAASDNVRAVREAGASLRWSATAAALIELYRRVCDDAPAPAGTLERAAGAMHAGFSEDAIRLVGPDGALPRDLERPLLALAMHPVLGAPVFRALKAGYRASHRLARGGTPDDRRSSGD